LRFHIIIICIICVQGKKNETRLFSDRRNHLIPEKPGFPHSIVILNKDIHKAIDTDTDFPLLRE